MRTCSGCRRKEEREEFLRFVEFEGKPVLDIKRNLPGRGYNVCPNYKCLKLFLKRKFKAKVDPDEFYRNVVASLKDYLLKLLSLSKRSRVVIIGQDNLKVIEEPGTLFLSKELSKRTKDSLLKSIKSDVIIVDGLFSEVEIGNALKQQTSVGVVFVKDEGIGRKLKNTADKLLKLVKSGEGNG
jgi:predicted RNA-binding protein YlxR (DUF448 family)